MSLTLEDPRIIEFDVRTDEMLVNMGPQHPSTHGVLRLLLRTDGEVIHEVTPHIGYLHRCAEKIGENLSPPQWIPYSDRMDYLAGMNMNLGLSLAVEKLVGMQVDEKAMVLRVLIGELGRVASHLVGMGAYGLDLGTFSPFLYAFREREIILDLFEEVCGARLTYSYITMGGVTHDLPAQIAVPPGLAQLVGKKPDLQISWIDACKLFLDWMTPRIREYHTLLTRNQIFIKRTAGLGIMPREMAIGYGCTGPVLRGSGVDHDLRRDGEPIYTRMYQGYDFKIPVAPFADAPPEVVLGDNWCRFYVRMLEVVEAIKLVRQAPVPNQFTMSSDGKKLLVGQGRQLLIVDAAPGAKPSPVSTNGMSQVIDPREEWKQLFTDAWRIERDFFYDPNMHGMNWLAVRSQYEKMLEDCASREDVGYVISEMISEMNVGHAYYMGGDPGRDQRPTAGLLGCEFVREQDAYKIAKFYEGAAWDVDARNPLRQAGIKEGEFLLAVNRVPLTLDRDPWATMQGLAGQAVVLTVSKEPKSGKEDRDVVVTLLGSDTELRYRQWIEKNRKYVEEKTNGRVGYVYVPDTGTNGQNDLYRQLYGQIAKEALIIDDRWNGGGQIPTRFIELLNRPVTNYWARRDGRDMTWPPDAHHGPKCMLINGLAGSGGDMFPALFRQAGLGKLIGRRTWGGLVGMSGNPGLIDGSRVTAPTFAYYEKDGTWGIEGHGVDPDIDVIDDPARLASGVEPQLDAAINHIMGELNEHPYQAPARPAYPDRSGFGIKPEDK